MMGRALSPAENFKILRTYVVEPLEEDDKEIMLLFFLKLSLVALRLFSFFWQLKSTLLSMQQEEEDLY